MVADAAHVTAAGFEAFCTARLTTLGINFNGDEKKNTRSFK